MDYQYKVIVSNQAFYKEFEIPADLERVKLGTTSNCEFRLNPDFFFEEIEIGFEKKEEWNILCNDNLYISRGDIRKLLFTELKHGDVLNICYSGSGEAAFELRFLIDFGSDGTNYSLKIDLSRIPELIIGDTYSANIELSTEYSKNTSVAIKQTASGVCLIEKSALYGTYVNGKRIEGRAFLNDYDFISVADFSAFYKEKQLYFSKTNIRLNGIGDLVEQVDISEKYPVFIRNTRIKSKCEESPIKILDPAAVPKKPELNIVTSLLPSIAMFALVVVLRGVLNNTGGSFVLFSICSMGLGVVTSVISILDKKKKYKTECAERLKVYNEYIENKKGQIEEARQEEVQCLKEQYYSTEQDLEHIEKFEPCLFDRTPEDEDFLDVYLGLGTILSKREIDYKPQEKLEVGDSLCQMPGELAEEYKYLDNAPVVAKLKEANAVGVVGKKEKLYEMFKIILIDIISRQYHGDITIYTLLDENWNKYDWLRLLPHIQGLKRRNVVCDAESKNNIFENLYKELNARSNMKTQIGYNIVFVMNENGIKSHPISKFIENASELNTVFIFFEEKMELLPLHCDKIIKLSNDNQAMIFESENRADAKEFIFTSVSDERLKKSIEILAPVFCEEISLEGALRKSISLFELLGIYSVSDLNLTSRWAKSKIYDSMAVPLGVNVKDDIIYLDLHEKFHGPHGLVAGTTGSGKSEILQTYILGAATLFHPYEIGFVIIDFKGGGMVNQFKNLPHLIGAITNIDGKAIDRSLKSIKAELLKRQVLFAEAEVNHIDKYIKAYKEGKVKVALPHLVIIVDEFAELKAEQPEFMKELISAARIGRSLGVHLILATQKPAGQVNDQIWSNSKFKLCLKVQTQEDSNEVLKSPLAAEIREPGRAYLQVGNNELFELLQSGFSGSPEKMDAGGQKSFDIYAMDFKGNRKIIYHQRPKKDISSRTQLEAIVDYVHKYCEQKSIQKLPEICLPALEESIVYDKQRYKNKKDLNVSIPIGIYDDPDHQLQELAKIEIGTSNAMIIGSSQYGKTNLLEAIIRSLAEEYSPEEVNLYIVDFASMVLKSFEKMAHVGGVVCPSDDEKLKNLFKYLGDQISYRREKLLSVGVSSFIAYKEAGYKELPLIVVFIDNFTALRELYLQDNDILLNLCREGNSVGISFIITNLQTNGLGYKYMANFASRIALFCNEPSEYSSIFGTCRIRPDEVAGRCLVEIDKNIFECQTFLAFEGEREIERIQNMQEFVTSMNTKYVNQKAQLIPEIPELLSEKYIFDNFGAQIQNGKYILGISYNTVSPVFIEVLKNNMLALSGKEESGKTNFIKYMIHAMQTKISDIDIFIFDNYKKKLSSLKGMNVTYEIGAEQCKDVLLNFDFYLQNKYQRLIAGDDIGDDWKVLVLNDEDLFTSISNDKALLAIFKNIVGKYKMLNVFVILGGIPNAQVVYGAPEIYKMVKESRNILFFDDLENCKLVDVSLSIIRQNRKKVEVGDAFYILGNDCYKIKTPLAVK